MDTSSAKPRLICEGLHVGRLYVPPFEARAGEVVKLELAEPTQAALDELRAALCRATPDGPVRAAGRIVPVDYFFSPSRLREIFRPQRAIEWLMNRTKMKRSEAESQLRCINVDPAAPISSLAGNPRWLIGFLAAKAQDPDAIVFYTAGLDPLGVETALATAAQQLGDSAGVYLAGTPPALGVTEPRYSCALPVVAVEKEPVA